MKGSTILTALAAKIPSVTSNIQQTTELIKQATARIKSNNSSVGDIDSIMLTPDQGVASRSDTYASFPGQNCTKNQNQEQSSMPYTRDPSFSAWGHVVALVQGAPLLWAQSRDLQPHHRKGGKKKSTSRHR